MTRHHFSPGGLVTPTEHEKYSKELLSSLSDDHPGIETINFVPNLTQSRNAARAMTAILCHRLFKKSNHQPTHRTGATYEWKEGAFNSRNIADRAYLWTNMRRNVANGIHGTARNKTVAYLLACSNPSDTMLYVWSIPEPVLYDSLSSLPFKEGGQEYTIQIYTDKQRIENCPASPDLTQYFREFPLSPHELLVLEKSREVDASVRRERAIARGEEESDLDAGEDDPVIQSETNKLLANAAHQLTEAGVFDPESVADARERMLASIVRRRGQPAFRQHLLAAYKSQCAITGCAAEAVLEAAHIVPYRGPETNHVGNGLLLRTDLHTLFDLKLVAVNVATMTLLVSPSLEGTCYEEYRGRPIRVPDDPKSWPSRAALEQHQRESGL
jgi:hypothetical protein